MVLDKMYTQNSIMGTAMQAAAVRNDVINNNIANAEVPGYTKKTVEFEKMLSSVIDETRDNGGVLDLSKAKPKITEFHKNFDYRIDGSNIDIETEMVDLYQNSVKYDTLASSIISNTRRINLVLTGR